MHLKLEQLEYQQKAIQSVVSVFHGQEKNSFDNACAEGIRSNYLSLTDEELTSNIVKVMHENNIYGDTAKISSERELCIEMETGTGKTLVYLKSIFELHKQYGFTKFIILVPSVAIKEGVLKTFEIFEKQLEEIYLVKPSCFEYDSKQLSKVRDFIQSQHPQIMVMTLQSFNSDDRILNQSQREDLFAHIPFIEAIAKTNPIIFMDEPQEGMDTGNSVSRISTLHPLFKIRYSATHKKLINLIYRLTPFESYKQGLVKKIEVLTVSEKNDEASMKIEVSKIIIDPKGINEPQATLSAWHQTVGGFKWKTTRKLGKHDSLYEATNNIIYKDYVISDIAKPLRDKAYVNFTNGACLYEGDIAKDYSVIFSEQLHWLIDTHFRKKEKLKSKGIKCLSLIFIDRVDNYLKDDGIIKKAFVEQFKIVHQKIYGKEATESDICNAQGYYFAQTGKGDFTDGEGGLKEQKKLYDLILKDKEELLTINNPVEFIFSHSALGVGWDNPNVFTIATLNQSYSEIKKWQEIGRGLRIAVNQEGSRVYDSHFTREGEEINLLTVIPNETYESFVSQYQAEIIEIYGTTGAGAETRNNHKGVPVSKKQISRNENLFNSKSFREFWKKLSKKTEYIVSFDENNLINEAVASLNEIKIPHHQIHIELGRIESISEKGISYGDVRSESKRSGVIYSGVDIIEEISENTALAYPTVFQIIARLTNKVEITKNPPRFIREAVARIKQIELNEMIRCLNYSLTGEEFPIDAFEKYIIKNTDRLTPTPLRGIYDHIVYDSDIESTFALETDNDAEVVRFLKLPDFYKIKTPAGEYTPDFGIVMKKSTGGIRSSDSSEFYFVIETKGTNDIQDRKSLTDSDIYKIQCAMKHFEALGITAYIAPVKEYQSFKTRSEDNL